MSTDLATNDPFALFKLIAMDVGKEVAHHIETMYPEAVKAAASTFLLSVRNSTYNAIMEASKAKDWNDAMVKMERRKKYRRAASAAWKKIRRKE